jgi:hypothetical protein
MIAISAMCFSALIFADQSFESMSDLEYLIDHKETINDGHLSIIKGKGVEKTKLYENDRLAVILWDERGNDNHRNVNNDVGGHNNIQDVKLIINQR